MMKRILQLMAIVAAASASAIPINVKWDTADPPSVNDYLKFDDVNGIVTPRSYAEVRTDLGLVVGTNVQAWDADLDTWATLTPSAFFQTLVDDASANAVLTTLGVDNDLTTLTIGASATVTGSNTGDSQTLANGVSDVTATAAELNLLDLSGLTAGWVLSADTATTASWKAQTGGGGSMTSFQAEDGDGTEVTIDDAKEWKFVEGAGLDINWTDTSTGSDADPFDLTFAIDFSGLTDAVDTDVTADDDFLFSDGGTVKRIAPLETEQWIESLTLDLSTLNVTTLNADEFAFTDQNATPASVGKLLYDNTVTGLTGGALAWHDGEVTTPVRYIVDLDTLPSDNGYVVSYNATNDEFEMVAQSGGSGDAITIDNGAGTDAIDTTAAFDDAGDIDFIFADGGAGGPDTVTANINAGAVQDAELDYAAVTLADFTNDANLTDSTAAETITGNWVNTANPWADNEVADALTIGTGSTISDSDITLKSGAAPAPIAEARIEWESDDDHILVGDGTDAVEFVPTEDVSGDATMDVDGALTIANNAVTLAKQADIADDTVLLRNTEGSGDPEAVKISALSEELTPASGDWILGETAAGEIVKYDVGDLPTGGGGEANTISSQGGGLAFTAATSKSGIDLRVISGAAADFDLSADVLSIDDATWLNEAELDAETELEGQLADVTNVFTNNDGALDDDDITDDVIGSLSNVVLTTPTTGQVLEYNGTNWVNATDDTGGGGANLFETVTAGVTDLVADTTTDTLTVSGGTDITVTGVAGTDTMTIAFDGDLTGGTTLGGAAIQTGTDDDVPESGDFGAAADLESTGAISDDTVDTAALDDGADTPLVGEWVQVATGGLELQYRTDAEAISDLGIDADITTLTIGASATVTGSNTGDQNLADTVAEITDLDNDAATLSLPANTTISAFGATIIDDADAAAVQTTLGVDTDIATLTIGASATVTGSNTGDSQTLANGVSDVTATAAELNLLDLSGLTAGWVLSADTATTASWKAQTGGSGLGSDLSSTTNDITTSATGDTLVLKGADESLTFDFDTATINEVAVTSTTGVVEIDFGTIVPTATEANFQQIERKIGTNSLYLAGGTDFNDGGNIILYGESHATNAGDIYFRESLNTVAHFDNTYDHWDFSGATQVAAPVYTEVLSATHGVETWECYGGIIYVDTASVEVDLPDVAAGMVVTIITIGNIAVTVDPHTSDQIRLDGSAADTAGDSISNASTAGDIAVFSYYGAGVWHASTNGWTAN